MIDTPPRAKPASRWRLGLAFGLGVCITAAFFIGSEFLREVGQTKRHLTETCLEEIAASWVISHADPICPGSKELQTECGPGEPMTDYWGNDMVVVCSPALGMAVGSAGVDRKWDTDDDIARIHLWPAAELRTTSSE